MSHNMPASGTQYGVSRPKGATVPRAVKSSDRQDAPAAGPNRSDPPTAFISGLPPLMTEPSNRVRGKPRSRPTGIPRISAAPSTARPAAPSSYTQGSRTSSPPGDIAASLTQEVPLVMASYTSPGMRETESTTKRPLRPLQATNAGYDARAWLDSAAGERFVSSMPKPKTPSRRTDLPPQLIPELQALAAPLTRRPEAFNTSVSSISSPSTRFSNSTSPWSVSTTTTTPTSWSSASPAAVQSISPRESEKRSHIVVLHSATREKSPEIAPRTERRPQPRRGERSVSANESDRSSSTQRARLQTPRPTPPLRTSSAQQTHGNSSSKSDKRSGKLEQVTATTPARTERRPVINYAYDSPGKTSESVPATELRKGHGEVVPLVPAPRLGVIHSMTEKMHGVTAASTSRQRAFAASAEDILPVKRVNGNQTSHDASENRSHTPVNDPGMSKFPPPSKLSRLGMFGRRGKSPAPALEGTTSRKLQRKGPAAGTGHEGYGKYSRRGRRAPEESVSEGNSDSERSVSSSGRRHFFSSRGANTSRSSSRQNRSSQSDLDDFAAPRMRPVPIIGGSRAAAPAVPTGGSGLVVHGNTLSLSPIGSDELHIRQQSQDSVRERQSPQSFDRARELAPKSIDAPTLAVRRSQRFGQDHTNLKLPAPIRTEEISAPLSECSPGAIRASATLRSISTPRTSADAFHGDASPLRLKDKTTWRARWNIFRRRGAKEEGGMEEVDQIRHPAPTSFEELPVSISAVSAPRSLPYYAMMDSESETNTADNPADFSLQLGETAAARSIMETCEAVIADGEQTVHPSDNSNLPSDTFLFPIDRATRSTPLPEATQQFCVDVDEPLQKQPRLARVGRIPQVVTRTEGQYTPSRISFSQPFLRREAVEDARDQLDTRAAISPGLYQKSMLPPSRKPSSRSSEISTSSSSSRSAGVLGPALVPCPPSQSELGRSDCEPDIQAPNNPSFDEVWNEYDDFIDQVMSPSTATKDASSTTQEGKSWPSQAGRRFGTHTSHGTSMKTEGHVEQSMSPKVTVTVAAHSAVHHPSAMPDARREEDTQLRRSRIVSALHSSGDPASPLSIRDFLSEYENHRSSSTGLSDRWKESSTNRAVDPFTTSMNEEGVERNRNHEEQVALMEVVERNKDPIAQSELHFASLMVAKWLSFGRVLFSPAHDELQTHLERHILVIDALGNEDWSIYCAVTYEPQRAFIHHLREKPAATALKDFKAPQNIPDNHRRAQVTSFYERFPFPPAFFSAIVLRFPPAMAEAKLKNIISECRRVLLPGGYLELVLLDLDIVNMGVQTRKAVRELKLRMTTADSQISLRPIIDNVQGLLGARGFSGVSRCVVGVPVAGRPTGSTESSSSSRSSGGSESYPTRGVGSPRKATASPRMNFGHRRKGTNLSLNDLVADHSENADAKIGKIVSRTARAWWQHCFEASVIPDGNLSRSVLANKNVLAECRSRGSSFKMLIAYAQRPVFETRRRTMSEPIVPTRVTAGAQGRAQQ
ncbi:hypothetical protein ABEF92_005598 [Exophiala dermatitidis]|uniref:Methyltransferase type 11 domain-containing protein n=2 Tax=Exophiala dermatitidis TaxID=5970 RepID=H6C3H5_EXODN|nr:uncharacterized protein HMPREF1120_06202 [Exophiala dermatitidis NIH/UT8656]EHY58190.1 hypothetical protein HMPREF1120_06202 [Exophiala dermatitidis NIH/UT8656]